MSSIMVAPLLSGDVLGSTSDSFVMAEWRDGGSPGSDTPRLIAPLHLHRSDDEAWYALEGVLRVRRGDDVIELRPGCSVLVPRGTPHTYWNPAPEPARYLLVMTPNIFGLIEEIHVLRDRSHSAIRAVFERHDSEILSTP